METFCRLDRHTVCTLNVYLSDIPGTLMTWKLSVALIDTPGVL